MPIAAGTWLLRGRFVPGTQPDGNSVLLRGADGWIVVDSGRHAAHAQRLLDFVEARGGAIAAVVNTHWHLDHVSGNPRLRAAHPGLRVYASDAIDDALEGFLARSRAQLVQLLEAPADSGQREAWRQEIARIDAGPVLRPDRVLQSSGTRRLAGRELRLGLARHTATAGDVWLYDATTGVLVAGDLVTLPVPFLDTACAPVWRDRLDELQATGFTQLLPGHGAPMDRDGFRRYRDAFDGLLECAAGDGSPDACAEAWQQAAEPLLQDESPARVRAMIDYYVQQRLRGPGSSSECPPG